MSEKLTFRADPDTLNSGTLPPTQDRLLIRTSARALVGMQKEAIVQYGPSGSVWRIVCDEGPWLNGSDLAPFPLAFFTAGTAASFMSEFLREARARKTQIDSLKIAQDNYFSMEGSALRGTMAAGVQPTQLGITASGAGSPADFARIAGFALKNKSPAERCLNQVLASRFVVRANNEELHWPELTSETVADLLDPEAMFGGICPLTPGDPEFITKSKSVDERKGPAVGLAAEQKRVVHIRTEGSMRDDGLKTISVQCIQPAGSCFTLKSDDSSAAGGQNRAPSGLAYIAAGAAFCFMTQIGRYAQITKQQLHGYRIVQDTSFRLSVDCDPRAFPIETLVCLDTIESEDKSIQLVRMAEQTCYIHAAYRTPTSTRLMTQQQNA